MRAASLELIQHVLSIPTMSFHEEGIATFVKWYSYALGLHLKEDRFGNLLVYNGSEPQGVVFSAHMDHPGFEVVSSRGRSTVVAQWGKVDPALCTGAKVVMYAASGAVRARMGTMIARRKREGRPLFRLISRHRFARGDFGHFDLPSFRLSKGRIFTRAADNLMSVAAILELFTRLCGSRIRATALFTRGEEAGFLGAFGAMETGIIPRKLPLIVLECSSAKHAKVGVGDGPVIRVGDWQSSYDPTIDCWIHEVADDLANEMRGAFRYQRELLPGGRCEACIYIAEGYRTGGIALPLGNYHNQGSRGPAAEYISINDYEWMVQLMGAVARARTPSKDYLRTQVEPIRRHYRGLKKKLLNSR